jgi:DNA-binding NtrC family response regulator
LNVIPIHVPSLARRQSDIPLLIEFFLNKFQRGKKKELQGFSPDAMDALLHHDWPGNVRELENLIKRMIILCENEIVALEDLPEHFQASPPAPSMPANLNPLHEGMTLTDAVKNYENMLIANALEKSDGVKAKAARMLNIKRTTLVEKLKKNKNFEADRQCPADQSKK